MKKLVNVIPDALIVCGAGALSVGTGMLHPAAGLITAGVLMIAGGIAAATRGPVVEVAEVKDAE